MIFGLPNLEGVGAKFRGAVDDYFKPESDKTRIRDVVREVPGSSVDFLQKGGQTSMRGFAAAASGLHSLGQRIQGAVDPWKSYEDYEKEFDLQLKPTGTFQETLFGTDEKITPGSVGQEFRGAEKQIAIDPLLGVMVGMADAIPGGSNTKQSLKSAKKAFDEGDKVLASLIGKYGKTIGTQIRDLGDSDLIEKAMIRGAEETVAHALNTDKVKMTVQKLIDGFKEINKARTQTESMRVDTRAQRTDAAQAALDKAKTAKEGFISAAEELKGKMPQAELPKINITDEEAEMLFQHIKNADIKFYERMNAFQGLGKIMGDPVFEGQLPKPYEVKQLQRVFGNQIGSVIPLGEKIQTGVAQVANVPRALMSSLDLSAPLRQGLLLSVSNPKKSMKAFGQSLKYFANEEYFDAAMDSIHRSPMQRLRESVGLDITDATGQNFSLNSKEEQFMTDLAGKIPVIGSAVKASERAYVGYLNKIRADVFDDVAKQLMAGGMRPETDPEAFRGVARFINAATGRGDLKQVPIIGEKLDASAPLLNAMFFSPRFLVSRLQFFNPKFYMSLGPEGRKMAAKSVLGLVGTNLALLSLASLNKDMKVETDPRSSDFGKIRDGDYRYDSWGGFQQWFVFLSRLMTGESKSAASGKVRELDGDFFGQTRLSLTSDFLRYKLAPIPGSVLDVLEGKNAIGEDVTVRQQLQSKLLPFFVQDLIEAGKEDGFIEAGLRLSPGIFGIGVQNFGDSTTSDGALPTLPSLPKLPSLPSI